MSSFIYILLQTWDDIDSTAVSFRASVEHLCYTLCATFGLVGGIRIYNKWQLHHRHFNIDAEIAGWLGASLFFLTASTFIKFIFY